MMRRIKLGIGANSEGPAVVRSGARAPHTPVIPPAANQWRRITNDHFPPELARGAQARYIGHREPAILPANARAWNVDGDFRAFGYRTARGRARGSARAAL